MKITNNKYYISNFINERLNLYYYNLIEFYNDDYTHKKRKIKTYLYNNRKFLVIGIIITILLAYISYTLEKKNYYTLIGGDSNSTTNNSSKSSANNSQSTPGKNNKSSTNNGSVKGKEGESTEKSKGSESKGSESSGGKGESKGSESKGSESKGSESKGSESSGGKGESKEKGGEGGKAGKTGFLSSLSKMRAPRMPKIPGLPKEGIHMVFFKKIGGLFQFFIDRLKAILNIFVTLFIVGLFFITPLIAILVFIYFMIKYLLKRQMTEL